MVMENFGAGQPQITPSRFLFCLEDFARAETDTSYTKSWPSEEEGPRELNLLGGMGTTVACQTTNMGDQQSHVAIPGVCSPGMLKLRSRFIKAWEDLASEFCGKFLEEEREPTYNGFGKSKTKVSGRIANILQAIPRQGVAVQQDLGPEAQREDVRALARVIHEKGGSLCVANTPLTRGKEIELLATRAPFEAAEAHLVYASLFDEMAPLGNNKIQKPEVVRLSTQKEETPGNYRQTVECPTKKTHSEGGGIVREAPHNGLTRWRIL
ncbi:hypothetical protein SESBI_05653 [Sesbania bispinosa]|nr:hypothetical protein SESBI_05653 [Sesbania bispinosa]